MKKKRFLKSMKIAARCSEEWNEMIGNDRVRFCSHCAKDVNNLSAMTRREALQLVRRSKGQLCMRYIIDPQTNAPMFAEQFVQIVRRAPRMAASVMTASLSLSAMAYAQGGPARRPTPETTPTPISEAAQSAEAAEKSKLVEPEPDPRTGVIRGSITDTNDAVIPGAELRLYGRRKSENDDEDEGELMKTASDYDGTFKFEGLAPGRYRVVITTANFSRQTLYISVADSEERVEDFKLSPQVAIAGAGVTVVRRTDIPALLVLVASEEIEEVKTLLAAGGDANVRDEDDGRTALFEAVDRGNLEMVELLLQFGAKVDVEDNEKMTPLMLIGEQTSLELVQLLLKKDAKVNSVDKEGDTVLIKAARYAKPEVLKALIDAGAELDIQNKDGLSALMNAADTDNLENVKLLVLAGADINLRDKSDDNAWDYAGEDEVEAFLVSHGVQLDIGEAEDIDYEVKKWLRGDFEEPAVDEPKDEEPLSK